MKNIITRNERKVGCPIIYMDTIHYPIRIHGYIANAWKNKVHSSIAKTRIGLITAADPGFPRGGRRQP